MPAGAFVYQKKSRAKARDGADVCERECRRATVAIQTCISKLPANRATGLVDHSRCDWAVRSYNECCQRAETREAERLAEQVRRQPLEHRQPRERRHTAQQEDV